MMFEEEINLHGFAVVRRVVPPEVTAAAIHAINHADSSEVRQRHGSTYAMRNVLAEIPALRSCAEHESVRRLACEILDGEAFITRAILFDKNSGANWAVPWHQDTTIAVRSRPRTSAPGFGPWSMKAGLVHVQPPACVLEAMVTVRIHLDDCGDDNGPLRVIAGSHRHGLLPVAEVAGVSASSPEVICSVAAGGAVIMRPLVLHASSPARVLGHRRVLHLDWATNELPFGLEWNCA